MYTALGLFQLLMYVAMVDFYIDDVDQGIDLKICRGNMAFFVIQQGDEGPSDM